MTWREHRIVGFLSAILGILFLAVLLVLSARYRENRVIPEDPAQPTFSEEAPEEAPPFVALTVDNGATTLSFSLDENGKWLWSDDVSFPLDDSTVTAILDKLLSWAPLETVTDKETVENAGLDQPSGSLKATTGTNTITTLLFGKTTGDGNYYVRLNHDEETVYVVDKSLFALMETPIYDMCILPQLPALPEASILSIGISGANKEDGSAGVTTVLTAQRAEGEGTPSWRSDGANVTDDPSVRALLEDIAALSFKKCIIYRPSAEALSLCGFDNPVRLTIGYTTESGEDEVLMLVIGNPLPDGSGRYVHLGEDTSLYLLPTASLDPLMRLSVNGLEP